jgi:hypothetical protein
MTQTLTTDTVERVIDASPQRLYDIVSDVTRMPELSPEITRCTWVRGATGPAVGARFRAVNTLGRGRSWPNWPIVVAADPGREFTVSRTEPLAGTLEWRYVFVPEGTKTRVVESYTVTRSPTRFFFWQLEHVFRIKDRAADLRAGMTTTLERLAAVAERERHTSGSVGGRA